MSRTASAVPAGEYLRRRTELMSLMEENSIAILPGSGLKQRNSDVHYPFRQDSDFQYLTGFAEPNAVLALVPGRAHGETLLFCEEEGDERHHWLGGVVGPDRARQLCGVDDAFPVADIDDILPNLIEGRNKLYYAMGASPDFDRQVIAWVRGLGQTTNQGGHPPGEFVQLSQLLGELRLIKNAAELQVMRRAAAISIAAHAEGMRLTRPGMMEYELQAELEYRFVRHGARGGAYPPIVGGGPNACILHYTRNEAMLTEGDLVLVDAGCELDCYAADVTRTYPVNGHFSAVQKDAYDVVLAAQQAAIDRIEPGRHWNEPHEAALIVIAEGLRSLGVLPGSVDEILETGSYRPYYMHRTGHWLGLDVHDVGEYQIEGLWRELEPGMVMTVEPGLYFDEAAPAPFTGMGIRIEDNVAVTRRGHEVLTEGLAKTTEEIESLMAEGPP